MVVCFRLLKTRRLRFLLQLVNIIKKTVHTGCCLAWASVSPGPESAVGFLIVNLFGKFHYKRHKFTIVGVVIAYPYSKTVRFKGNRYVVAREIIGETGVGIS